MLRARILATNMEGRILQLNCQGSYAVMVDLGEELCEAGVGFALLQEPYVTDGCVRGLPAFMRAFPDARGDSAVVVCEVNVDCMVVSVSEWGVCVAVEGAFGGVLLASVYCKFGVSIEPYLSYLGDLFRLAGDRPLIVGMDANATSPLWFSKVSASSRRASVNRGVLLAEWIMSDGVSVLNAPCEEFTFDGPRGVSDIDVSLANGAAIGRFAFRWGVRLGGISDHNMIVISFAGRSLSGVPHEQVRWRCRGVDWRGYCEGLVLAARSVPLSEFRVLPVDDQVALLDGWVRGVNDGLLGRVKRSNPVGVRWWTRELGSKKLEVRRLRHVFQRSRRAGAVDVGVHRSAYLRCLREYKGMIVDVKEREWREFVHGEREDPWGRVYGMCRGRSRTFGVSALRVGGEMVTDWTECVNVLLREFFPRAVGSGYPLLGSLPVPPPLDDSEVCAAVGLVKAGKSPGMDGMTGQMCRCIYRAIPEYLGALLAGCLLTGCFPRAWKLARVVVLLKAPDRVKFEPRSYRGICLLPVLSKVLERVMVWRLQERVREIAGDAGDGDGLSEFQFGFRRGRSVEDAWMYVRGCVDGSSSVYVLGLFIDFKGAFDNLSWSAILGRLREVGCREYGLWRSYFSGRRACVVGVSGSVMVDVVRGCPQGSICGPYVWNLIIDPLLTRLSRHFKVCAYADDLLVMVEGGSRADLERGGELAMRLIAEWGAEVGVEVAMDKSSMMLFKGRLSLCRPPVVRLNGASLRYVTEVKYLGITMGERMNFLPHLFVVRKKLVSVVGCLRRILRSEWGLGRRAMRVIYNGLFVACASYGAAVWGDIVRSAVGRRRVLSIQRLILLGCIPVCRTVSTSALQVLAGAPPLDLEILRRSVAFRVRRGIDVSGHDWLEVANMARLSVAERRAVLSECVLSRWQSRWDSDVNGRVTFGFIRDVRFVIENPEFDFGLSLGYILTGHGSLNGFLCARGLSDTSECDCGGGVEDWMHVLCECALYEDIRDLSAFGVVRTDGGYDVGGALVGGLVRLRQYAVEVFRRRRLRSELRGRVA